MNATEKFRSLFLDGQVFGPVSDAEIAMAEADLGSGVRPQVSFKDGKEVHYGTAGSVRPDWCCGDVDSIEVKNYNIANNMNGLIDNVAKQAIKRQQNLPSGMQQLIVIDVRGQVVTPQQEIAIRRRVEERTNGIVQSNAIRFKTE